MTRSVRLTACACALSGAAALGGCAGVPAAAVVLGAQATLAAAASSYCASTTEQARQAVRDRLTGGIAVIPCPEAE